MFNTLGNKKVIVIVSSIAAVSFLALVYLEWGRGGAGGSAGELARVNGYSIYWDDIKQIYRALEEQYRDKFTKENRAELEKEITKSALFHIIQRVLLLQAADEAGIVVSDDLIFSRILRNPELQTEDGKFNDYLWSRIRPYIKHKYEDDAEKDLKIQLMQSYIYSTTKVSDIDLRIYYMDKYTQCKIKYVFFPVKESKEADLLVENKEKMRVEKEVDRFVSLALKGRSINYAASIMGKRVKKTTFFSFFGKITNSRGEELKDLEVEDIYVNAFRLLPGQISKKIILNNGFVVFQIIGRRNPDWKNFYRRLLQLRAEYEGYIKNLVYRDWYFNVYRHSRVVSFLEKYFKK